MAEARGFPIHREPDTEASSMPLTFSPKTNTASPAALMLTAALMSRSCSAAHSGHVQARTCNGISSITCPQAEQRLELGYHWSTLTSCLPAHSALYAICRTNSPQPASLIDLASERWRSMFFTLRDSTQITWFSLTIWRDSLCKRSIRQSEILA